MKQNKILKKIKLNESNHTMEMTKVNLTTNEISIYTIPSISVSTLKGFIYPFDLSSFVKSLIQETVSLMNIPPTYKDLILETVDVKMENDIDTQSVLMSSLEKRIKDIIDFNLTPNLGIKEKLIEDLADLLITKAILQKDKILQLAQTKGTCVHRQLEHYINNKIHVGCMHNPVVKSHEFQFKNFLNWFTNYENNVNILDAKTEIAYVTPNETLTGIQDVLIETDSGIEYGDWKTTSEPHEREEAMQLVLYRFLRTGNFNILDTDKFFVYNTNIKNGSERFDWQKLGKQYYFTKEEINIAVSDAKKSIEIWNNLPKEEKINIITKSWELDHIADANLIQRSEESFIIPLEFDPN